MSPRPFCSPNRGFTLIELMISLVIISIALLALATLQVTVIWGNALAKRMTTAISLAEQRLEQLKDSPYATIQAEAPAQVTASNLAFTRQVTVTTNSPLPNTKTVSVSVSWRQGSKTYTVPVATIMSK